MKRIITVPLFAFLVMTAIAKESQVLSLNVSKIYLTQVKNIEDKLRPYHIEFHLKNESNDNPICFWNMSCSWCTHFVFANENLYMLFSCKSNAPLRYLILPKMNIKYEGIIVSPTPLTQNEMKNLQVGFIFCDALKFTYEDYLELRHGKWDVIGYSSYIKKPLIVWNIGVENNLRRTQSSWICHNH